MQRNNPLAPANRCATTVSRMSQPAPAQATNRMANQTEYLSISGKTYLVRNADRASRDTEGKDSAPATKKMSASTFGLAGVQKYRLVPISKERRAIKAARAYFIGFGVFLEAGG